MNRATQKRLKNLHLMQKSQIRSNRATRNRASKLYEEYIDDDTRITVPVNITDSYILPEKGNLPIYEESINTLLRDFYDKYNIEYENATCDMPATQTIQLKAQQKFVSKYINLQTPFTGMVLWHGLGSGKTLSAISISEQIIQDVQKEVRELDLKRKYSILFVPPAMLKSNFEEEVKRYDKYYKKKPVYGTYYTSYTSNGKLSTYKKYLNPDLFKHKVIIIDESQLLIKTIHSSIINNKHSSYYNAYLNLMSEETSKVVCLSGTPIVSNAGELAVLFNILSKRKTYYEVTFPDELTTLTGIIDYISDTNTDIAKSIDMLNTIRLSSHPNRWRIYRNVIYFHTEVPPKIKYTSDGNAFTKEEFEQELQNFASDIKSEETLPLFNVMSFNSQYGIQSEGNVYNYNVTTHTSRQRETDILSNATLRSVPIKNSEEFVNKVTGYMSYFGNINKIVPKSRILPEATSDMDSNTYKIGYDNNSHPLFTIQRCECSDYQEAIMTYSYDRYVIANDIYKNLMTRNSEHFVYPFDSIDEFTHYLGLSERMMIEKVQEIYHSEHSKIQQGMYGKDTKITLPQFHAKLKYIYSIFPDINNSISIPMYAQYETTRRNKHNSIIQMMSIPNEHKYPLFQPHATSSMTRGRHQSDISCSPESKRVRTRSNRNCKRPRSPSNSRMSSSPYSNQKQKQKVSDMEPQSIYDIDYITQHIHEETNMEIIKLYYITYKKIINEIIRNIIQIRSVWVPYTPENEYCNEHFGMENLQKYSSKMFEIMNRIVGVEKSHIIYSQYKQVNIPIARMLSVAGYEQLKIKLIKIGSNTKVVLDNYDNTKKHYMFITGAGVDEEGEVEDESFYNQFLGKNKDEGQLKQNLKQHYINIFNGDINDPIYSEIKQYFGEIDNVHGNICNVIILNSAAAEGITLKNVRYVHLLHPPSDMAKIYQIIGRAIRNCTHKKLPESERNVTPILYLSKLKSSILPTKDEVNYNKCVNDSDAYVPYLNLLKTTAVDCELNKQIRVTRETGEVAELYPDLECKIKMQN
jgi:hypothetical protein